MQYTHDVIIIGAGIAGSAMALACAKLGLRIALLDKKPPEPVSDEISLRVSNINFTAEKFLNTLGVSFPENRRGIFKDIKVLQENSSHTLNFSAATLNLPYLGSIIENNLLIDLMQKTSAVNSYWPITLEKFANGSLHVKEIGVLSAPLVIGAEGAHSWLREQCGILQNEKSYGQTAMVTHIATQKPHANIAYQCFLSMGPLAYLPLQNEKQCSIVWSSTPAHIDYLMKLDDVTLAQEIAAGLMQQLGPVEIISKRATFPLMMRHAKHYIAPGVALIGDAIHTIHPLAGQGANLGLMDVACLFEILKTSKDNNRDIGSFAQLRPYERKRRFANTMMLNAIQLLAQNQQPFASLRALGMNMIEHSTLIKRLIMLQMYPYAKE
ncbi:MAG: FAD-dependent oxidoreductase [Taibaiella sp.]|jgi:2-octaprenylphenol hydroxylase